MIAAKQTLSNLRENPISSLFVVVGFHMAL